MSKREHIISFRLTNEEAGHIDTASASSGRTTGDWCRAVALGLAKQSIPALVKPRRCSPRRLPTYDIQTLSKISGHLGKLGSNVNQLAKVANTVKKVPETATLKIIHAEIIRTKNTIQSVLFGGG
jgi:hypothetical protein